MIGHKIKSNQRQHCRCDKSFIERTHDRVACTQTHEECANDGSHDTCCPNRQRIQHHGQCVRAEEDRAQHHRCHNRHSIGLEQVCGHASTVAHIIAHIVSDCCRV